VYVQWGYRSLGYDVVSMGKWFLPFSRKVMPSSAKVKGFQIVPRRQRHCVPFKHQVPTTDKVWYPK